MQLGCAMPGYDRIRAILWALGTAKVLLSSLWAPHLLCDLSKTQQLLPSRAALALGTWERFPSWDTSLLCCHLRCRALTKPTATSTDNVTSNWLCMPQIHSHTCQQARREKPITPKTLGEALGKEVRSANNMSTHPLWSLPKAPGG